MPTVRTFQTRLTCFPPIVVSLKALLALIFALCLVSCKQERLVDRATRDGILILGNGAEPPTLEIQQITGVSGGNIVRALFEGLCTFHPSKDDVIEPGAAERWESNEDMTVWTFHLRPQAVWSDGVPVTAHDFVFSYRRMLEPKFAAKYSSMLYYIKGAEDFNKSKPGEVDFSTVGVKALDDYTLQVTLRASINLPEITKHTTWYPVPKHIVLKYGDIDEKYTGWTDPGNMVSNGAFTLKSRRLGHSIIVEKNPRYWDADSVELNEIQFLPISNAFTESRMFRDGLLHKTYRVPSEIVKLAREDNDPEFHLNPYLGVRFIRCNLESKYLGDRNLRLALSHAIDRDLITSTVTGGNEESAIGQIPPFGEYQSIERVSFDPKKAREFLDKAEIAELGDFPEITFLTTDSEGARRVAEVYQSMWREHLGLNIRIEAIEWGSYLERQSTGDYDLAAAGWIGDFLDPTTFLDMWRPGDGNNNTGWESQEYVDFLTKAENTGDAAQRLNLLAQAEAVLLHDAPVIPVYYYTTKFFLSDDVKGWNALLLDNQPYKHVSLDPSED